MMSRQSDTPPATYRGQDDVVPPRSRGTSGASIPAMSPVLLDGQSQLVHNRRKLAAAREQLRQIPGTWGTLDAAMSNKAAHQAKDRIRSGRGSWGPRGSWQAVVVQGCGAGSWHVRLRFVGDGWVEPPPEQPEPTPEAEPELVEPEAEPETPHWDAEAFAPPRHTTPDQRTDLTPKPIAAPEIEPRVIALLGSECRDGWHGYCTWRDCQCDCHAGGR